MNRLLALAPLALALFLSGSAPGRDADTVVVLVRHAEKAGPSGDVALSPAGEARALALVDVARGAGVTAVITTQFQRTKQTAAPAAKALGITPEVVEAKAATGEHASAIAELIRGRFGGRTVLVVGHSNTVPAIIGALGAPKLPDICDEQYDQLFVVVVSSDASPRLIRARYGESSPLTAQCAAMK